MTSSDDDHEDVTEDEFDRAMEQGEPVELIFPGGKFQVTYAHPSITFRVDPPPLRPPAKQE